MGIDIIEHENIDNTNNINLVLASVENETISEAFKDWIRDDLSYFGQD